MKGYIYVLFFVAFLITLSCRSAMTGKLDFTTIFDLCLEFGKPNYKDVFDIKVIDCKDIRAFIIPFHDERRGPTLLPNGDVEEGPTTYDTIYVYCIYRKGQNYGLRYDSLNAVSSQRFPVDSLMDRINIGNKKLEGNAKTIGRLDYALKDKKTGKLLVEKFVLEKDSTIDSTYRYYDPSMERRDFTIAPLLDKKYHTKIVKLVAIQISTINKARNVVTTEIKAGQLKEPALVDKLIERFKNDSLK